MKPLSTLHTRAVMARSRVLRKPEARTHTQEDKHTNTAMGKTDSVIERRQTTRMRKETIAKSVTQETA